MVLSAISLPSYGLDTGTNLVELVEKCAQVPGIERIRLGSLDPDMLTPEFISRLAAVDKLCPQFHLSLQSGCTATLRRMRRVYTAQEYAQVVEQIRAAYGSRPVSFTTDCICGFPGETADDFEESCEFLKKIGFLKVHVFPYSRRSGTPAYVYRLHPAVHPGGGLCPRVRERADRTGKAGPLRRRAGACSTLLKFFHFTYTFCASA